jgi:hypothetical protein
VINFMYLETTTTTTITGSDIHKKIKKRLNARK